MGSYLKGILSKVLNNYRLSDIRDYYHAPSELRKVYRDIWRDYVKVRLRSRFIRNKKGPGHDGKVVLIPGFHDLYLFKPKLDSMLVTELQRRGWRAKVLLWRADKWQKRYYRAFGLNDFIYLDDIEEKGDDSVDRCKTAEEFMSAPLTIENIRGWKYRNVLIGPSLLERILKTSHGVPNVTSDAVIAQLRDHLACLLTRVQALETIVDLYQPDLVLVIDSILEVFLQLVDIAVSRNIEVIHYYYLRDNVLGFKKLGKDNKHDHPHSVSLEVLEKLCGENDAKLLVQLDQYFDDAYSDKWQAHKMLHQPGVVSEKDDRIKQILNKCGSRKTAVIFSHLLWDHNMFYGQNLFATFAEWLMETVAVARENDRVNWIIKLHPANRYRQIQGDAPADCSVEYNLLKKQFGKLPAHINFLHPDTAISTLELMKNIDYGLTVRGTVGAELPCFGVPVLTAGSGRYSGFGFTIDSVTKDDYLNKVEQIHCYERLGPQQVIKARWHAYALFKLCAWEMKSFRCDYKHFKTRHALSLNIDLVSHSWREIDSNGDLAMWADWALSRSTPEFCARTFQ